jgi:hypothetical protein
MSLRPQNLAVFSGKKCRNEPCSQIRVVSLISWKLLSVVFLFGIALSGILSGNEGLRFSNFSTLDGLPQGGVLSFEQDSRGGIWF